MINQEISKIIKLRQSVFPRHFNGRTIDNDIVLELLNNANTAPSHRMTQPWSFKVFSGKSKEKLINSIRSGIDLPDIVFSKLNSNFKISSHIICICMSRNKIVPEWEEIASTAMAVQNIWLSCADSKIGGYWSTPSFINQLQDVLKLNNHERCLGFFYLGMYNDLPKRNLSRTNIEEKIDWFN